MPKEDTSNKKQSGYFSERLRFSKPYGPKIWRFTRRVIYAYCGAAVVANHVGGIFHCVGVSMEPTIRDGDFVIAERLSVKRQNIWRGDLVCAIAPYAKRSKDDNRLIIKRVIAKEYDMVERGDEKVQVPRYNCYLLGDNAPVAFDSRDYGPVPVTMITDRIVFRIWPLKRMGSLSQHAVNEPEPETV